MLQDGDYGRTSLVSKILFQLGERMRTSQHKVKHCDHSNTSTILKLNSKCETGFMPTGSIYFVKIK